MASSEVAAVRQRAFLDRLLALGSTVAPGKRGVPIDEIVELVKEDPDSAIAVGQGFARLAAEDANLSQRARSLGAAYEIAFDDDLLTHEVESILAASGVSVPDPQVVSQDAGQGPSTGIDTEKLVWIEITPSVLEARDIYPLVQGFGVHDGRSAEDRQKLEALCGRAFLTFPVPVADPRPVWAVPDVRAYVYLLKESMPYLPIFFTPDPDHSMFLIWFGALAPEEALVDGNLRLDHESVMADVANALRTAAMVAELLGVDPVSVRRNVMAGTPAEWQDSMLQRVASLPSGGED